MVSRVGTVAFQGIEAVNIDAQVHIAPGLPHFTIVGLPDKAVAESRERIRAALHAMGMAIPPKRITVNLAPADFQKEGSHYDLPIALALLMAMEALPSDSMDGFIALGEMALDGALVPVSGILPAALFAASQNKGIVCPAACGSEAKWGGNIPVLAAPSLLRLINHIKGVQMLSDPTPMMENIGIRGGDLRDIKGQETAKRVLEIAAAGNHNVLMLGPPGSGKSMLASRLPGLLPLMDAQESLEVTMIHSISGKLKEGHLLRVRPFRDPHHSASLPSLVGGGHRAMPGEVSLAHMGVLFLDELPEFARGTLESLRQVIETGRVTIARANNHITYPARFQLIAAMNPCKCGFMDDTARACSRAPQCGIDYQSRISGPLLDRFDLSIVVPAVQATDLSLPASKEGSADVAARVERARNIQKNRYTPIPPSPIKTIRTNSDLEGQLLDHMIPLTSTCQSLLNTAAEKFKLSARGYHRVLKVARTIADLDASDNVHEAHLSEALSYRRHML